MSIARIYKPAKTATQSGRRETRKWVLEFEPEAPKRPDPVMGWPGGSGTRDQVRMRFESREAAVRFAEKHGLDYRVQEPGSTRVRPKSYAANFLRDISF